MRAKNLRPHGGGDGWGGAPLCGGAGFPGIRIARRRPYHEDMKPPLNRSRAQAFTLVEILVVVGVFFLLTGLLLPTLSNNKRKAFTTVCINNLKQVTLAQIVWASDHGSGDRFAFVVPAAEGGLRETALEHRDLGAYYKGLASELLNPKILACPTDREVIPAQDFTELTTARVSYFMNLGPASTNQSTVLHGDRKLDAGRGGPERLTGLVSLPAGKGIAWQPKIHNSQHRNMGNVAMTDGSVMSMRSPEFQVALFPPQHSNAPVRLLFP